MTKTNYSDYGLYPDEDFSSGISTARKQLNLIKYFKNGLEPWNDPMCPPIFSCEEIARIRGTKRNTIKGRRHLDLYRVAAGLHPYSYFFRSVAENYQSIVIRVARERVRSLSKSEDYDLRYHGKSVLGINESVNRVIVLIDKKYGLHPSTKRSLGFDNSLEWQMIQDRKEEAEKINCIACGRRHNNKKRYWYWRGGSNKIFVEEHGARSEEVTPYCEGCSEVFMKSKAKADYRAEKASNEACQIGSLLRKIKQEIKLNASQNQHNG